MNAIGNLKNFILGYVSLTDSEYAYFASFFEIRKFKKREIFLREGEIEKYLNFIQSGLARLYFVREKEEVVIQFSSENEIICCYESFLSGKPSVFSTQAIEPMVVLSITLENLENLFAYSPKIERLGRLFATQEYLKKAAFDYNRVRVNTKERFIDFVQHNGNLLQRTPQKYLASYLDIKPETFSRMKHFTKGRL
jgi:CRP-like cAMP-binding protein